MRFILSCLLWLVVATAGAQSVEDFQTSAREQQRSGNFANAVTVLTDGLQKHPGNLDLLKDLALTHYLAREYKKGITAIQQALSSGKADEQVYQIASTLYRGEVNYKDAEAVLRNGLKAFPNSGLLYSELGDVLEAKSPGQGLALPLYEDGIRLDPAYPGNYYRAAKALYAANYWVSAMLYAEIYCNLDSYTARTTEMKNLLNDCLRKSMQPANASLMQAKGKFEQTVHATMLRQAGQAKPPFSPEMLTAMRTRFVLDWFQNSGSQWPFALFELHQSLLRQGLFDAYTQWLIGPAANLAAFENWTKTHDREYKAFLAFRQNRVFSMPAGQYYR